MPLYLNELDVVPEVEGAKSVLIVPCRMCPATSLSLRNNKPLFEFFVSPVLTTYHLMLKISPGLTRKIKEIVYNP